MTNIIHTLKDHSSEQKLSLTLFLIFVAFSVIFGVLSGFFLYRVTRMPITKNGEDPKKSKKIVGIEDRNTFKDQAEGILREGGINGEGNFHLERPGGPSQNVYLTSSVVDLSLFIGKKVRVWGKTFAGEKAGWLMDVGSVEILDE
ncbi:MAG: hypothetical protein NZL96_01410 [Patescibacteria group bacterium]|nr:hypothetical protein [Patescibacteria group bacterium]